MRIAASTPSGGDIKAVIAGPGTILSENTIVETKNGAILIGEHKVAFILRTTDAGPVTVKVTTTGPVGGQPKTKTYQFQRGE